MERRRFVETMVAGVAAVLTSRAAPPATDAATGAATGGAGAARRALAEHRIAKMESRRLQDRFPRTVGANSSGKVAGGGGGFQVRTIVTDQGVKGWAMSAAPDEEVKRFVGARVGDLFDVERGTVDDAVKIDLVLHDLAGVILGKPVHALLGDAGPKAVPVYSGAIYFDDLLPASGGKSGPRGVAGVLASCRQDYEAGYRAFKLKIGRGFKVMPRAEGLRRDIEVTRAVRQQFPDSKVLVDANDGFTVEEAIEFVRATADCDLYWIEEPFKENREGLLRLREAMVKVGCRALIADGESGGPHPPSPTKYGGYRVEFVDRLFALASEKLVDVFLWDLGTLGYSRWRRLMPELKRAGIQASPHTWMWTPRPYFAAQLAAGVGNIPIVEGIPGRAKGIDYSAYKMESGALVVPDTPGFGLRLT